MGQSPRLVAILLVAASAGMASPALADSRIFTARASEDGVTIEKAVRNGKELPIVGRGEGTTLFRIDSPSTPVGCANRIAFFTSTGEQIDQVTDMCALNWSVTVQVEAQAMDEPAQPAATTGKDDSLPPVPAVPGAAASDPDPALFSQTVTVSTDNPAATILTVSLDGKPVEIASREGRSVVFEIEGTEEGIVCDRQLGLTLSNGRKISRKANICLNDWTVVVSLSGKDDDDVVIVDAPSPQPAIPPAPDPAMSWAYSGSGGGAALVYGVPQTDAAALIAECGNGSGEIAVTLLDGLPPDLEPGDPVPITFSAGDFSQTYPGEGSPVSEADGVSLPQITLGPGDPLWQAIIREKSLAVTIGTGGGVLMSLSGSAGPTRRFLATCSTPAVAQPVTTPAPPRVSDNVVIGNYFCADGSVITVNYRGNDQTAVLLEPGAPPITLFWSPNGPRARYTAGEARLVLRGEGEIGWSRFGGRATLCATR